MAAKKFGFLALTFILVSTVLIPALLTDTASAQCLGMNCPTPAQDRYVGCDFCGPGRDYDRSGCCTSVSQFRCDVYHCAWETDYSCSACSIR